MGRRHRTGHQLHQGEVQLARVREEIGGPALLKWAFAKFLPASAFRFTRYIYFGVQAAARGDARCASQALDRGVKADARGTAQVLGRGAEAVAHGAARRATQVLNRGS